MTRILIAGLLGGLAMFVWTSIAHTMTPLGEAGVSAMPNEAAVTSAMTANLAGKPGLYMFPAAALQGKAAAGPSGLLIYGDAATEMTPATLVEEAVVEILEAVVAAVLLSFTVLAGYWSRVAFVAGVGLAAVLSTNPSYWLWYRFPASYTLAAMVTDFVGYVVAGLVIAAVRRRRPVPV
jgi:hypothetical protein